MGKIVSAGGRKLYRHESGMGTVMEFNDGQDHKVLVLDAQYRFGELMGNSGTASLPQYSFTTGYINGGSVNVTPSDCETLTDEFLNNTWFVDENTSKYNTDAWLSTNGTYAPQMCRSITVNGIGCDIPNFQTLLRIYCEAANLDLLDPTVSSYSDYKLSDWLGNTNTASSTRYSVPTDTWGIDYRGQCYGFQVISNGMFGYKTWCPVLELT